MTDEMIHKFNLGYALQQENAFTITAPKKGYPIGLAEEGRSDCESRIQRR